VVLLRDLGVQLVYRRGPRELLYFRRAPVTIKRPTPAQAEVRLRFAEAARESKLFTIEEVARLVGGEVVEVHGRKMIKMPDGRLLMKHMAYVSYAMRGYRSPQRRLPIPAWLEEISRRLYLSVPAKAVAERVARPG
jgi:hypothetical protein